MPNGTVPAPQAPAQRPLGLDPDIVLRAYRDRIGVVMNENVMLSAALDQVQAENEELRRRVDELAPAEPHHHEHEPV